jgi:hypothetical protein
VTTSAEQVAGHVQAALNELLTAAVLIGGVPFVHVPDDALDAALRGSASVQDARQAFNVALRRLRDNGAGADVVLDLEAAVNALAARCAEVGFGVGSALRQR